MNHYEFTIRMSTEEELNAENGWACVTQVMKQLGEEFTIGHFHLNKVEEPTPLETISTEPTGSSYSADVGSFESVSRQRFIDSEGDSVVGIVENLEDSCRGCGKSKDEAEGIHPVAHGRSLGPEWSCGECIDWRNGHDS